MTSEVGRRKIHQVLASVLVPLARTLLRFGVTYTEFAEIAKRAYVRAAEIDYGVRNRPASTARVAVLTGLSRKEAKRVRDELEGGDLARVESMSLPAEVLEKWHVGVAYCDPTGAPRSLQFEGKISFSAIVREINADISPKAVVRELLRSGAVRPVGKTRLLPTTREFVPSDDVGRALQGLQYGLRRLSETVCRNSNPTYRSSPYFERVVYVDQLDMSEIRLLRDTLAETLERYSILINDQIAAFCARRRRRGARPKDSMTIGVGMYYFDDGYD
jgi:hypothetical protein